MAKEKKDKIEKLEAEIGRMYMTDTQLTGAKNANLQQLKNKLNELEKLKQEK